MPFLFRIIPILALSLVLTLAVPAFAGDNSSDDGSTPPPVTDQFRSTSLPLPRFASLKSDKTYIRTGPGQQYPIEWVYQREGLPVEITQEFGSWRKIRDSEGGEGWISTQLLSGRRNALIIGSGTIDLREGASPDRRLLARLEPGVIATMRRCNEKWCEITTGGYSGWVQRISLWGIYATEELN